MPHLLGAREHNLKNVDVDIPRDALVVFTGVPGSGKSQFAFGPRERHSLQRQGAHPLKDAPLVLHAAVFRGSAGRGYSSGTSRSSGRCRR